MGLSVRITVVTLLIHRITKSHDPSTLNPYRSLLEPFGEALKEPSKLLKSDPLSTSGLMQLCLEAPDPDRPNALSGSLARV